MNTIDGHDARAEALANEMAAYDALYKHAFNLSQQAPQGVRAEAFAETLRNLFEQDRMQYILSRQQQRAEPARIVGV